MSTLAILKNGVAASLINRFHDDILKDSLFSICPFLSICLVIRCSFLATKERERGSLNTSEKYLLCFLFVLIKIEEVVIEHFEVT